MRWLRRHVPQPDEQGAQQRRELLPFLGAQARQQAFLVVHVVDEDIVDEVLAALGQGDELFNVEENA